MVYTRKKTHLIKRYKKTRRGGVVSIGIKRARTLFTDNRDKKQYAKTHPLNFTFNEHKLNNEIQTNLNEEGLKREIQKHLRVEKSDIEMFAINLIQTTFDERILQDIHVFSEDTSLLTYLVEMCKIIWCMPKKRLSYDKLLKNARHKCVKSHLYTRLANIQTLYEKRPLTNNDNEYSILYGQLYNIEWQPPTQINPDNNIPNNNNNTTSSIKMQTKLIPSLLFYEFRSIAYTIAQGFSIVNEEWFLPNHTNAKPGYIYRILAECGIPSEKQNSISKNERRKLVRELF